MKFCTTHWESLRQAITDRGLDRFVSPDGEELARRLADESQGNPERSNFDPLMGAHNAILSNALRIVGVDIIMPSHDGSHRCPLCFVGEQEALAVMEYGRENVALRTDSWIDRATIDMLDQAKALGLVAAA